MVSKIAACGCNKGLIRANNEDNFYFAGDILAEVNNALQEIRMHKTDEFNACFAIFDGMGGEADGQVASYIAAELFSVICEKITEADELTEGFFEKAALRMNNAVYNRAAAENSRMGCTAVMLGFSGNKFLICNVGDSRAYRFRTGNLTQLTIDHTVAGIGNRKGPLSQCIGMPPDEVCIVPYKVTGIIQNEDLFLLCSDGLTDMVPDNEIAAILAGESDIAAVTKLLIQRAIGNGGRDNITVIAVRIKCCGE